MSCRNKYIFQDNKGIVYKEGLIGLRIPVTGHGKRYDRVLEEWKKAGETEPINVSVYFLK